MQKYIDLLKIKKVRYAVIAAVLLLMIIPLIAVSFNDKNVGPQNNTTVPHVSSTPSGITSQRPFQVIKTQPVNGEQNVFPGEFDITFTTNEDVLSAESYSVTISPKLPYYWKIENSYPTKQIVAHVYGSLDKNTKYTVTVNTPTTKPLYTWSFTTSTETPDNASGLVRDQEEQEIKQYYPLFDFIPYESADFDADYTGRLTLEITMKTADTVQVKQEVETWIRSHGVDPATHTINYINGVTTPAP